MKRMPMGGGMPNMNQLMKQAQKMQSDMQKVQEELSTKEYEITAGGGAISVKVNGQKQLVSVSLKEEIIDPDDKEMLEDLIVAAVNEALKKADDEAASQMKSITGGMGLPGMF